MVWKVQGLNEIRVAADSRVSLGKADAKRVTDQAAKIFSLKVAVHGETSFTMCDGPMLELNLGFVYAGAVVPALMTHAAASMMLGNLYPETLRLPRISDIARLICHLSDKYIRDAVLAYANDSPPQCEFVIFGLDTPSILEPARTIAYWIHPKLNQAGVFEQVMERVDLEEGEIAVIGIDAEKLRTEISQIESGIAWNGLEPRIALQNRMLRGDQATVGGTLQFGILEANTFKLYGSTSDDSGNFQQNWLGFDCQNEISNIIGMTVMIPALP